MTAVQRPGIQTVTERLQKLLNQNGRVRLTGILVVTAEGARHDAGSFAADNDGFGETEGAGRDREGGPEGLWLLRGLVFSGCSRRQVVYQGRPLGRWIQDLKDRDKRDQTVQLLLRIMGDEGLVKQDGCAVITARTWKDARHQLSHRLPDLLILDLALPEGASLKPLRDIGAGSEFEVFMANSEGSVDALADLPPGMECLPGSLDQAWLTTSEREFEEEGRPAKRSDKPSHFGPMVGAAPAMQTVYELITRVAPTDATVLVTGESGTGKELVAQALHAQSRRCKKPYFVVNCGAISPSLIDSELFGHEQGSFTGANHLHKGHFERANGGTIFLDEITEMPLELQVKLLRVLENGDFMRVGGDQPVTVDVRVIAATNRRLEEAVAEGKLREDLLYRLNVFPINLPPVRDRRDDIDLLAEHFLNELNRADGVYKKFTRAALERLRAYHWPGNVRELKNAVQRAFILSEDKITAECLPKEVGGREAAPESSLSLKVGTPLAEAERRLILATFDHCEGNKMKTAEVLGISLRTLYNRLDSYWNNGQRGEAPAERRSQGSLHSG